MTPNDTTDGLSLVTVGSDELAAELIAQAAAAMAELMTNDPAQMAAELARLRLPEPSADGLLVTGGDTTSGAETV